MLDKYVVSQEGEERRAHCPLHKDENPSAYFNYQKGLYYCHSCGKSGKLKELIKKIGPPPPTMDKVNDFHVNLLSSECEPVQNYLMHDRDIDLADIAEYQLGWDHNSQRITIPVYDVDDNLINIRYYKPGDNDWFISELGNSPKMLNTKGYGQTSLFGVKMVPKVDTVVINEGELDAIVARGLRWVVPFAAVSSTNGAKGFRAEWAPLFQGKKVYILYDCDQEGREGAWRTAQILLPVADSVHIVDLQDAFDKEYTSIAARNGDDLTDWVVREGAGALDFHDLLANVPALEPPDVEDKKVDGSQAITSTIDDTKRGDLAGTPLEVEANVIGNKQPPYQVPAEVSASCDMAWSEKKCPVCPMYLNGGDQATSMASNDLNILRFMDKSDKQSDLEMRDIFGIPKNCPNVEFVKDQSQNINMLLAKDDEDSDPRIIHHVGDAYSSTNQRIRLVGTTTTDPRDSKNLFFTWDLEETESNVDTFEVDETNKELMQRFQPDQDQTCKEKLWEIAQDMCYNVTHIHGREELQIAVDLVLHSVLYIPFEGKEVKGWLDFIVIGDTRTGKSETAARTIDHYGLGRVIDCETTTVVGLVGGVKQHGKEWMLEWGSLPQNDRGIVVLDEAGGLPEDAANQLSSVRSSGVADIQKVESGQHNARTRLIWICNPEGGGWMGRSLYGVQEIQKTVTHAEDIARFDFAMAVRAKDVPFDVMHQRITLPHFYTADACRALALWAWSRTKDQVVWEVGAEAEVIEQARWLIETYVSDPPLVQHNVHEKVARIAVAVAARLFSTDESCTKVIVTKDHVHTAVQFIHELYRDPALGYAQLSQSQHKQEEEAEKQKRMVVSELRTNLKLRNFLHQCAEGSGRFRSEDLDEYVGSDTDHRATIQLLYSSHMIDKEASTAWIKPRLNELLRELAERDGR